MANAFKVWCKNNKEWEKNICLLREDGTLFQAGRSGGLIPLRPDTHEVVRFAGLYDNTGNPIYEGDILQYFSDIYNKRVVEFLGGSFMLDGKGIYHPTEGKYFKLYNVIGNIYENPELKEWR